MRILRNDSVPGKAIQQIENILREHNIVILDVEYVEIHGEIYSLKDISGGSSSTQLPRMFEEERFVRREEVS